MSTPRPEESRNFSNGLSPTYFTKTPPRTHKITKLGHLSYLGFLEWMAKDDAHLGLVHAAEIHHPHQGRLEVCVKMFPDEGPGHRGLMNEVTGWLLAHLLQINQPSTAAVVNVPLAKIKQRKGWLRELPAGVTHWPAFCSERINAKGAAVEFNNTLTPTMATEISAWGQLAHTIILDEHIGNGDRHVNNLLRLGPKAFAVIDHDRLACDRPGISDWTAASLQPPERPYTNQLHQRILGSRPLSPVLVQELTFGLPLHLHENIGELLYWAEVLVQEPLERTAWVDFIKTRCWLLSDLVNKRLGMLHGNLDDRPSPEKYAERFRNVIPF